LGIVVGYDNNQLLKSCDLGNSVNRHGWTVRKMYTSLELFLIIIILVATHKFPVSLENYQCDPTTGLHQEFELEAVPKHQAAIGPMRSRKSSLPFLLTAFYQLNGLAIHLNFQGRGRLIQSGVQIQATTGDRVLVWIKTAMT
jgi:hypothetical protein